MITDKSHMTQIFSIPKVNFDKAVKMFNTVSKDLILMFSSLVTN